MGGGDDLMAVGTGGVAGGEVEVMKEGLQVRGSESESMMSFCLDVGDGGLVSVGLVGSGAKETLGEGGGGSGDGGGFVTADSVSGTVSVCGNIEESGWGYVWGSV